MLAIVTYFYACSMGTFILFLRILASLKSKVFWPVHCVEWTTWKLLVDAASELCLQVANGWVLTVCVVSPNKGANTVSTRTAIASGSHIEPIIPNPSFSRKCHEADSHRSIFASKHDPFVGFSRVLRAACGRPRWAYVAVHLNETPLGFD